MSSYPLIRRVRRGRRAQMRRRLGLASLVASLPLLFGLYVMASHLSASHAPSASPMRANQNAGPVLNLEQLATVAAQAPPAPASDRTDKKGNKHARLVYQYSVVPGGVQNARELAEAVAHDPSVARHYARFDFQHARLVRLRYSQKLYISYRRNGRILWTRTPHLIRAGEKVITDGKVTARTRCGNRLASRPRGLTAPEEPTESQLEQPVAMAGEPARPPVTLLAQNSAFMPPLVANGPASTPGLGGIGIPIRSGPIVGGGGSGVTCETEKQHMRDHRDVPICPPKKHHNPPPQVPEPGTLVMVGSGMLALSRRYVMERLRSWIR